VVRKGVELHRKIWRLQFCCLGGGGGGGFFGGGGGGGGVWGGRLGGGGVGGSIPRKRNVPPSRGIESTFSINSLLGRGKTSI